MTAALQPHTQPPSPLVIPLAPASLSLPICTTWDGQPEQAPHLQGEVRLAATSEGLLLRMSLPHQEQPRIPDAPPGVRVGELWTYDVVECFLSGPDGYTEVELGAGGHFLVLTFSAPRVRADECLDFLPVLHFERLQRAAFPSEPNRDSLPSEGTSPEPTLPRWCSQLLLPWKYVPEPLRGGNAYVIVRDRYLCFQPLPGPKPDFHQPSRFPQLILSPEAQELRRAACL